jgi:2-methylcitrate dehydratase PrpD
MQKITVDENPQFTAAFNREPQEHRARITVLMGSGEQLVGSPEVTRRYLLGSERRPYRRKISRPH